ncbi:AAA family ATPase [Achromobacter piechaudii]|nr:AAA family ATPase [Achromobacter piechaudii]
MAAAKRFFSSAERMRDQKRFDFSLGFAGKELGLALSELFHGKCAYCEQAIETGLDRFRPSSNSLGIDGKTDPNHYWWLAYDWSNLYFACNGCSRAKANRFPVSGKRSRIGRRGDDLVDEMPMLLDPCADQPEDHLQFDNTGRVIAKSERGHLTIETLALNRPQLVQLRKLDAKKIIQELNEGGVSEGRISRITSDTMPFAAMRRNLVSLVGQGDAIIRGDRLGLQEQHRRDLESTQYTVGPDATAHDRAVERSRTRYIERVVLKNVGIHGSLDLRTARTDTSSAPWMMLLGENGVGKTTLLKAIVLALAVPQQREKLVEHSLSVLPRDGKIGSIVIHYTDGEVIRATIDSSTGRVKTKFVEPRFRLLALGATRLPPTSKRRPPRQPSYAKVMNLFDPFCPLEDSVSWLARISDSEFGRAGGALKALLGVPNSAKFERAGKQVALRQGAHRSDLQTLSDGYQTIIGVACSIMSTLVESDQPVETAEGIVLIDEIGNHLHPTWRMRIVRGLKAAFPRVQFIATTHEPLCLRGLEDGEIAVLRRNTSQRSMLIDELPPVRGLLVDQILSSPHFGLGSTIDPETAEKFETYYGLLAKGQLSPKEVGRLESLQDELNRIRLIGNTPSEQILLRTIDERVARANSIGKPLDPSDLPKELRDELAEVLELATKLSPSRAGGKR